VSNNLLIQTADAGKRTSHQLLRDPYTEFTGDQLIEDKALAVIELIPSRNDRRMLNFVASITQRQESLFNPIG
jgi:hypothetical protein